MGSDAAPLLSYSEVHDNPCAELVELNLFLPQGASMQDFHLGAETRFGTMTIAADDQVRFVEFGLAKAVLRLTLNGCRIEPGQRLFDKTPVREITTDIKRQRQSASMASAKGGLNAAGQISASLQGLGEAKLGADLSGAASREKTEQTRQTQEESYILTKQPVLSVAGNRWEFSALGDQILVSKYTGDEPICKIVVSSKQFKVIAELYFFAKDIVILDGEANGKKLLDFLSKSPNKSAIAKILLAKNLRDMNDPAKGASQISGAIVGSRSLITSKDEGNG